MGQEWNLLRLHPWKKAKTELDGQASMRQTEEDPEAVTEIKSIHQMKMALIRLGLALESNGTHGVQEIQAMDQQAYQSQ